MLSIEEACQGFSAIGSEPRMGVLLCLVQSGPDGLLFGRIADRTGIPASTLAHHLRFLAAAGLVDQRKNGRQTINTPNFERLQELSRFVMSQCCLAVPDAAQTQDQTHD